MPVTGPPIPPAAFAMFRFDPSIFVALLFLIVFIHLLPS